jgi:hypothetical protein
MLHVFKLISGEDIFAWIRDENETGFIVEDPCTVLFDPTKGILLKHWMSLAEDNVTYLPKSNILSDLGKANELAEYYYHTYMYEAKKVNADALESYRESVKEADSLVDDFFIHTVPPNRRDYN